MSFPLTKGPCEKKFFAQIINFTQKKEEKENDRQIQKDIGKKTVTSKLYK